MSGTEPETGNGTKLTRKEQELLELLKASPGRCFSRAFLLQRVWGYRDDTRTRTVDVHISRLRKKLDQEGVFAIHTVVRRGYVLESLQNDQASGGTLASTGDTSQVAFGGPAWIVS